MAVEVVEFREYVKNTLQGFLTIRMTNVGLDIRDIAVHRRNGERWLQLPAKPYNKPDGSQGWNYILCFPDKDRFKQFQSVTLKALDEYQRQAKGASAHGNRAMSA